MFKDIIAKYWELFNGGKEPVEGDRNALTFELAVTIRSICGYSLEKLMQVVPNYWAKSTQKEPHPFCVVGLFHDNLDTFVYIHTLLRRLA